MPAVHAYRMVFDLGFAPNPFHGQCTLATCKPRIRARAAIGDYVIGTSSYNSRLRKRVPAGSVLYLMRITGETWFDAYWHDPDHAAKRPDMAGSRVERYGDNIYHHANGDWQQADSRHSRADGTPSPADIRVDTGTTDRVLVSTEFTYWGERAIALPPHLACFGHRTLRETSDYAPAEVDAFVAWADPLLGNGRIGWPSDWTPA